MLQGEACRDLPESLVGFLSFRVKADGREEQMRTLGFTEAQLAQGPSLISSKMSRSLAENDP